MKLVVDTDVIVAAMRSPSGASSALIASAAHGKHIRLLASIGLAMEYQDVCSRAEHVLAAGITREDAWGFVQTVIALCEPVETYFLWRPQLDDPNDEMVLEAAVNGRANALVTFNRRHFIVASQRFGIEILTPAESIRRIRQ